MTYLVQRIEFRENLARTGLDRFFLFDYIGSAEFEFGAMPQTLAVMRKRHVVLETSEHRGFRIVSPATKTDEAKAFIDDQLGPKKMRLKEASYIDKKSICGWWCLDEEAHWAVFRTKTQARLWRSSVEWPYQAEKKNQETADARD